MIICTFSSLENMSAAVAELFNGHGVANGNPAGMATTDDANHSNKENKVMVTKKASTNDAMVFILKDVVCISDIIDGTNIRIGNAG